MKRICTTFALLSVLAAMFFFFGSGTASAQTVSASKTNVTPLCSGYTRVSQVTQNGVTLILWKNNCTGQRHCEAKDISFTGNFDLAIIGSWTAGTDQREDAYALPFTPGSVINSPNLPGGASEYACYGFKI